MDNLNSPIPNLEIKIFRGDNYEIKTIEGNLSLISWLGFQSRQGAYGSADTNLPSDGSVKIQVGGDMVVENPAITTAHANAYYFLIDHQESIKNSILNPLMNEYKDLQELYNYDEKTAASIMPNVDNVLQFKNLIGLSNVHLMNVSKDNIAYTGYEFGCSWDDEHGLGVMTHKNRVIKIGGADTSFLTWVAEEDIDPEQSNDITEPVIKDHIPQGKKHWWKFW